MRCQNINYRRRSFEVVTHRFIRGTQHSTQMILGARQKNKLASLNIRKTDTDTLASQNNSAYSFISEHSKHFF